MTDYLTDRDTGDENDHQPPGVGVIFWLKEGVFQWLPPLPPTCITETLNRRCPVETGVALSCCLPECQQTCAALPTDKE